MSRSYMLGSTGGAFNFWYIEALWNGSLATFARRSASSGPDHSPALLKRNEIIVPFSLLEPLIQDFKQAFKLSVPEIAYAFWPNPFRGISVAAPAIKESKTLSLVDGSESGLTISFWTLLQQARHLDLIIAWEDDTDAHRKSVLDPSSHTN